MTIGTRSSGPLGERVITKFQGIFLNRDSLLSKKLRSRRWEMLAILPRWKTSGGSRTIRSDRNSFASSPKSWHRI